MKINTLVQFIIQKDYVEFSFIYKTYVQFERLTKLTFKK